MKTLGSREKTEQKNQSENEKECDTWVECSHCKKWRMLKGQHLKLQTAKSFRCKEIKGKNCTLKCDYCHKGKCKGNETETQGTKPHARITQAPENGKKENNQDEASNQNGKPTGNDNKRKGAFMIYYSNINHIRKRMDEIKNEIAPNYDALTFAETWLDASTNDKSSKAKLHFRYNI